MPLRKSVIIEKAQNLVLKGLFRQAIKEWQRLLTETPNDGNIFNAMGDLHLKAGDKENATASYIKSADAFRAAGFELKSIALFKKALKVDPSRVVINEKLASVYAERGLIGNAIDDYLKAAKHYLKQGDFRSSLSIYRKISNLDPDNENIRLKIAEMCEKQGFKEEAVEEYKKIMAIYGAINRTADLDKITKKILAIDPTYYKEEEPSLQKDFNADVALDSELVSESLATASTSQEVPLSDQAVSDFLEPEPSPMAEEQTLYADESLFRIDREDEQSRPPEKNEESLPDKDEKSLESSLTEADVYLKYGLTEKAIRHLNLVLESFPSAVQAHIKLKDIYIQQGKTEKAVEECSILCRLYQERDDQEKREAVVNELMMLDSKKQEKEVFPASGVTSFQDSSQAEVLLESALSEEALSCASVPDASISDSETWSQVEIEKDLSGDSASGETSLSTGLNEEADLETEEAVAPFSEIASSILSAEDFILDEDSLGKRFEERDFSIDRTEAKSGPPAEEETAVSVSGEGASLSVNVVSEVSLQVPEEKFPSEEESFSLNLDEPTLVAGEAYSSTSETLSSNGTFFEEVPLNSVSDNKNELSDNTQALSSSVHRGLESEGYVDLHAILSEDLGDSGNETALEKTIRYFQSEAEGETNAQEIETQYDLGIAYKEMGMLSEAVKAFEEASKGEVRFSDAVTMLAACHRELGSIDDAIDALREKLSDPYCQGKAGNILKYELAQLCDVQGDKKEAFLLYDAIFQADPAFRDVESKISASARRSVSSSFSPSTEAVHSLKRERIKRRNRVSYL